MAKLLEKSLYIDDLITGEEDNESAHAVYKKSKQIMPKVDLISGTGVPTRTTCGKLLKIAKVNNQDHMNQTD